MKNIFPFDLFPFIDTEMESTFFIYNRNKENFSTAIVKAKLRYCPGTYMICDYTENNLGEVLYVGESGFKKGRIVDQQLPERISTASLKIPNQYPACGNKREIKRYLGWNHMMECDNLDQIIFFIFYPEIIVTTTGISFLQTPAELQNRIIATLKVNGQVYLRWSTGKR